MELIEKIDNYLNEAKYKSYEDDDNSGWAPDNSKLLNKELKNGRKFVAICGVNSPKIIEWPLVTLNTFDKKLVEKISIKSDEYIFRLIPRLSNEEIPFVKVNPKKGMIYFLTDKAKEEDLVEFENKGTKLSYFRYTKESKIKM